MTLFDATQPGVLLQASPGRTIALRGGTLFDGSGDPARRLGTLLIVDGKIASIDDRSDAELPPNVECIDTSGRTIMPGLVDAHVHLTGETTLDPFRRHLVPAFDARLLRSGRDAARMLASGCTTVRDCGSAHGADVRRAIRRELIRGPRVLASLQPLTSTGGRGEQRALPTAWVRAGDFDFSIADGVDECRFQCRRVFREGGDLVSVMISGGVVGEGVDVDVEEPEFSPEELSAMSDETRRRQRRLSAHVVGAPALRMALEAGVDTIEGGAATVDQAILARMAEQRVVLVPTLSAFKRGGTPLLVERAMTLVRQAREAGVIIAAGSDSSGAAPASLADEITALVEAGLSASEALTASTQGGAAALGLEEEIGTVVVGKSADLLILSVDPLAEPAALVRQNAIVHIVQRFIPAPAQDTGRPITSSP